MQEERERGAKTPRRAKHVSCRQEVEQGRETHAELLLLSQNFVRIHACSTRAIIGVILLPARFLLPVAWGRVEQCQCRTSHSECCTILGMLPVCRRRCCNSSRTSSFDLYHDTLRKCWTSRSECAARKTVRGTPPCAKLPLPRQRAVYPPRYSLPSD